MSRSCSTTTKLIARQRIEDLDQLAVAGAQPRRRLVEQDAARCAASAYADLEVALLAVESFVNPLADGIEDAPR